MSVLPAAQSGPSDGYGVYNINQMRDTHSLIVLFEGADSLADNYEDDHAHCSQWYATGVIARYGITGVLAGILEEISPQQHYDCANYLYADGHASTVPFVDFQQIVSDDIANSTNSFRPLQ